MVNSLPAATSMGFEGSVAASSAGLCGGFEGACVADALLQAERIKAAKRKTKSSFLTWISTVRRSDCQSDLPLQHPVLHAMRRQILPILFAQHGFVVGPVAQIHLRLAVVFEGDDVRADAIQEPAVVADDQGRPGEF